MVLRNFFGYRIRGRATRVIPLRRYLGAEVPLSWKARERAKRLLREQSESAARGGVCQLENASPGNALVFPLPEGPAP